MLTQRSCQLCATKGRLGCAIRRLKVTFKEDEPSGVSVVTGGRAVMLVAASVVFADALGAALAVEFTTAVAIALSVTLAAASVALADKMLSVGAAPAEELTTALGNTAVTLALPASVTVPWNLRIELGKLVGRDDASAAHAGGGTGMENVTLGTAADVSVGD